MNDSETYRQLIARTAREMHALDDDRLTLVKLERDTFRAALSTIHAKVMESYTEDGATELHEYLLQYITDLLSYNPK